MSQHRKTGAEGPAILQIVPSLDAGGAERSTIEMAEALSDGGFAPLVVSEGGRMVADLEAAGGEWIPMHVNSKAPHVLLANARRLGALIGERNVRLVHARSRAPAWSALWATRRTATPFVTTFHGAYSTRLPLKRLYNSVMLRADAVIANSEWTAEHIRTEYSFRPKRLVVVRRGVDLRAFDPAAIATERIARLRETWSATEHDLVVLLPGRLTSWKGQLVLIDAVAIIAREGMPGNLRVILAGDAQGRNDFAAEIDRAIARHELRDRVSVVGHVTDMPAAYRAADIVVSASTDPEAFGRVAAEASAMKRPVIATDHGGARETVLHQVSGLLVPPGDAAALAAALTELIAAGPSARSAMGANGRDHIREHFTLDRMTGATIALYRELLGRSETG